MSEITLIVIGAAIGFCSSIGILVTERLIDRRGKLTLYYKLFWNEKTGAFLGFEENKTIGITLRIPIRIEIQNTTNTTRAIRDLSMIMYNNGTRVKKMIQVNSSTSKIYSDDEVKNIERMEFGSKNNSYSFVIPPRSITRETCAYMFTTKYAEIQKLHIDEIRLSYYDERDREHLFHVRDIKDCWKYQKLDCDEDWNIAR